MVHKLLENDQQGPAGSLHSSTIQETYFSPEQVGRQTAGRGEWLCKHCPSEPINALLSQSITCAAPFLSTLYLTEKEKL